MTEPAEPVSRRVGPITLPPATYHGDLRPCGRRPSLGWPVHFAEPEDSDDQTD